MEEYKPKTLFGNQTSVAKNIPRDNIIPKPLFTNKPLNEEQKPITKITPLFGGSTPAKVIDKTQVAPKVMFGDSKIRKRIEVNIEELRKYNKDETIIKEAHYQIVTTNVDELNYEFVLNWGAAIQVEHQNILDTLLNSALDTESNNAKSGILKIIDLINSIDFDSLHKTGLFTASKESKLAKINAIMAEVRGVSSGLSARVDGLKAIWKGIITLEDKIKLLSVKLEPYVISCDFFANYTKENFPSELFITRLTSLMSTKFTLIQNLQQQDILEKSAYNLIDAIQGTIRTEIPMWQNNYLNALTTGGESGMVKVNQERESIVSKLKNLI